MEKTSPGMASEPDVKEFLDLISASSISCIPIEVSVDCGVGRIAKSSQIVTSYANACSKYRTKIVLDLCKGYSVSQRCIVCTPPNQIS